ncbi:phage tail protein [Methylocystis sp. H62]|jgi:microcystin-dependent protein|uniref:phage tail protein n=1 Tax=Methylocystis sp. H62 TaxID=2785789 RepID=UPI0018C24F26|nr:tail fiber protein [Methylocystis sp. H62]MBG0794542.1 phage tail protein [Methylocystis sp. H62]
MSHRLFAVLPIAASLSVVATFASISPAAAQAEPFLGQLMLTGATFCPRNWAQADGQLLSISQNTALFSLYGTTYGGNGSTTFALPDLRGRAPIHQGTGPGLSNYVEGQVGGRENFTITTSQMPAHNHGVQATNATADKGGPDGRYLGGGVGSDDTYHDGPPNRVMAGDMIQPSGGGQPVSQRGPYLTMMWCVALQGIFPSRN